MSKIFRLGEGSNTYTDWNESPSFPYNSNNRKKIQDPDGATAKKEITSIPSPFARIDLVKNAVNKTIGKFTKGYIMELVPSVGKTSIENSLKTLIDEGVIGREGKGKATFYFRKN